MLSQLPTHETKAKWTANVFAQSSNANSNGGPMIIAPSEDEINGGRGYYTIGIHSHSNATFRLTVAQIEQED